MGTENISIIINLNPSKIMLKKSRHALNFSSLSKEISIHEKPIQRVQLKNRFSDIIRCETQNTEDIQRQNSTDKEKERLEAMAVGLPSKMEQIEAEKDIEIIEEKESVRDLNENVKVKRDNVIKERKKQGLREK